MKVYLMGICGTAMGHTALLLRQQGHEILGADTGIYPPMSTVLQQAGITVLEGYDPLRLQRLRPDCVVVGNVISRGNPELEWLLESRAIPFHSMPRFLGEHVMKDRRRLVIAGTHGKTTTTTLTALLLRQQGLQPGWLIGGVPQDLPSGAELGRKDDPFVIEGDEYDSDFSDKRSKFVHYWPHIMAVNNVEFDHGDIFRDVTDVQRTFSHGLRLVPRNGFIVANGDDHTVGHLLSGITWTQIVKVGTGPGCDLQIRGFRENGHGTGFELVWQGHLWQRVEWQQPGLFNARNAAMAAMVAALAVYPKDPVRLSLAGLAKFQGVLRRQQVLFRDAGHIVIEDFGHHPTAVHETLRSLRARYPGHRLIACLEPRSNTAATGIFQEAFTQALMLADEALVVPPPKAKQRFENRLDIVLMANDLRESGRSAMAFESCQGLLDHLLERTAERIAGRNNTHAHQPELYCFYSNGSFDGVMHRFAEHLQGKGERAGATATAG